MPKLIVDGKEIEVADGTTLLQACEMAGAEIPRFCYHERLSIAGNCRMCLVEVKGAPKPMTSCALSVNDLRPGPNGEPPEVFTDSEVTRRSRKGVMEFLLINHPLVCPICDQGGECDLQDQAMGYGMDHSRFREAKRGVENREIGSLIKTGMARCIKCTRCVRFVADVAGIGELGAIGRGENIEITTYLDAALETELQGNLVDLCPVGALLSKPYLASARPWELKKTQSIDVMDAMCANIRIDTKYDRIMRILPALHEGINEEWISDKTRHVWDGLAARRLDRPWVRENGRLREASWDEALEKIAENFPAGAPEKAAGLAGALVAAEEAFAFKTLMDNLGVKNIDCRPAHAPLGNAGGRAGYLFNATIAGIGEADAILIIGANPRYEASVLNTRIYRAWAERDVPVALLGEKADLPYAYDHLGEKPDVLMDMAAGKGAFLDVLKQAKRPLVILGMGALSRPDAVAIWGAAAKIARDCGAAGEDWNGFSILHTDAGLVGALDAGCLPGEGGLDTAGILNAAKAGELSFVWLLGADDVDVSALGEAFVVYTGSHGDAGAHRADVILPGAAYTEKDMTWVNMEGRPQMSTRAVLPPGEAREDWAILRAASERLGKPLDFDTIEELRARMYEAAPHLAALDSIEKADPAGLADVAALSGDVAGRVALGSAVADFWLTNAVARASKIMNGLSAERARARAKRQAAE